jgi:hypothetical protein
MRFLTYLTAISLSLAAGYAASLWALPFIPKWLGFAEGDPRRTWAQAGMICVIAWFVGQPLWSIAAVLCRRRRPLTPCPDCEQLVSRLATLCPHCGRPLSPVRDSRTSRE